MSGNYDAYKKAALNHFKLIQTYERAPDKIEIVMQGEEGQEFWNEFGLQGAPDKFQYDDI
jgi:hypothetical protein